MYHQFTERAQPPIDFYSMPVFCSRCLVEPQNITKSVSPEVDILALLGAFGPCLANPNSHHRSPAITSADIRTIWPTVCNLYIASALTGQNVQATAPCPILCSMPRTPSGIRPRPANQDTLPAYASRNLVIFKCAANRNSNAPQPTAAPTAGIARPRHKSVCWGLPHARAPCPIHTASAKNGPPPPPSPRHRQPFFWVSFSVSPEPSPSKGLGQNSPTNSEVLPVHLPCLTKPL